MYFFSILNKNKIFAFITQCNIFPSFRQFFHRHLFLGKLHFAPPFHSEHRAEGKRHGVRNEKTRCSEWKNKVFGKGGAKRSSPLFFRAFSLRHLSFDVYFSIFIFRHFSLRFFISTFFFSTLSSSIFYSSVFLMHTYISSTKIVMHVTNTSCKSTT